MTRAEDRMVERAERVDAVTQLASGVAHDFNHILGIIKNYTKFILKESESDGVREDAEVIMDAVERGTKLSRALMRFSQSVEPNPEIFDINSAVERVRGLIGSFSPVNVEINLGEDLWPIKADRNQIEQVIINLALNAKDAMGGGGGTLRISTSSITRSIEDGGCDEVGLFTCLTVEDTGKGIPAEIQDRIFEPFFTTKDRYQGNGGSGLGLAMCYGIVRRAGGQIQMSSRPGKTTFTVQIPAGVSASSRRDSA